MNGILIVAEKEMRQVLSTKSSILVALFFALWFGGISSPAIGSLTGEGAAAPLLDTSVFYMGLVIAVFIVYLLSGQVFLREKQEGVIETLLCTPLSLREIWLGKVIGVTAPAYAITLAGVGAMVALVNVPSPDIVLPSAPVILHLLVVVPLFAASAVGLLGFIQLLLGLRENQIFNIIIFAGLFFLLFFMQTVLEVGVTVSWSQVGAFLLLGALLLAATGYLARFLSKEKIIRTIP
jgi:ABC-2 type transport system permease protein